MGVDPEEAMAPFIAPIDAFHDRTRPTGWLEGLVKAYVGDGIATDFYREISAYVDPSTQELVRTVLQDVGQAEFAVRAVREATEADPRIAGRLALWGRRLVGEALSQAQRVAVERDALASLLVGGHNRPGADLAELGRMFARLTDEHTRRMDRLGPGRLSGGSGQSGRGPDARRPRPRGDGASLRCCCGVSRSADLLLAGDVAVDDDQHGGHDDADDQGDPVDALGVTATEGVVDEGADEGPEDARARW